MKKIVAILLALTLCFGFSYAGDVKASKSVSYCSQLSTAFWAEEADDYGYGPTPLAVEGNVVSLNNSIKLKEDISFLLNEDIVFDLNNHQIDLNGHCISLVGGQFSLKITNSGEGRGIIESGDVECSDSFSIVDGTLELNNIDFTFNIVNHSYEPFSDAGIEVNFGEFKAVNCHVLANKEYCLIARSGIINLVDSHFECYGGVSDPEDAIIINDKFGNTTTTITNSTIEASDHAIVYDESEDYPESTMTLNSGTIEGMQINAIKEGTDYSSRSKFTFYMKGGTFIKPLGLYNQPNVVISGGQFRCQQTPGDEDAVSIIGNHGNLNQFMHKDYYLAQGAFTGPSSPNVIWLEPGNSNVVPKKKNAVLNKKSFVYNGKKQIPGVTVYDVFGNKLKQGKDYKISNSSWADVGTWSNYVEYIGDYKGVAKDELKYSITKANSPMTVTAKKTVSFSLKKIKKKRYQTKKKVVKAKNFKCNWATYMKVKGNKHIYIWSTSNSKACNVTVYKGIKKGTYKIKVRVDDAGSGNYKSKKVYKTIKVKIKK